MLDSRYKMLDISHLLSHIYYLTSTISHLLSHICHLLSAICCLLSAFALGADDVVTVQWSKRENPSREALFSANATLGNAKAMWSSSLSNMRAHGANGRHLQYSVVSGKTSGFCGLISSLGLTVNGIDCASFRLIRKMSANGSPVMSTDLNSRSILMVRLCAYAHGWSQSLPAPV